MPRSLLDGAATRESGQAVAQGRDLLQVHPHRGHDLSGHVERSITQRAPGFGQGDVQTTLILCTALSGHQTIRFESLHQGRSCGRLEREVGGEIVERSW